MNPAPKRSYPRSMVERIAPALDWALLGASLITASAVFYSPQLAERARATRVVVDCSAAFGCSFQIEQRQAAR